MLDRSTGHESPLLADSYANLADIQERKHRLEKAHTLREQALAVDRAALPASHPRIAKDLNNLGSLAFRRRRYREAADRFREALDIDLRTNGPRHPDTAIVEANLAHALALSHRPDEAAGLYAEAIGTLRAGWGQESPKLLPYLETYARFLESRSESARAETIATEAVHIQVRQAILAEHSRAQHPPEPN